jgi:hypothetical protein
MKALARRLAAEHVQCKILHLRDVLFWHLPLVVSVPIPQRRPNVVDRQVVQACTHVAGLPSIHKNELPQGVATPSHRRSQMQRVELVHHEAVQSDPDVRVEDGVSVPAASFKAFPPEQNSARKL